MGGKAWAGGSGVADHTFCERFAGKACVRDLICSDRPADGTCSAAEARARWRVADESSAQFPPLIKGQKVNATAEEMPAEKMGLFALVREDFEAHGRDWTRPGFRAIAVYRFGGWRMRIRNKLLRAPLSVFYRVLFARTRNIYGIELPYSARIGRRVVIEHQSGIVIHGESRIGNDCYLRQGCTLGNRTLGRPFDAPTLGERVNVGAGAKILGKISIGDDATIGANAVVLIDVPPGATAVGVPARIVSGDLPR